MNLEPRLDPMHSLFVLPFRARAFLGLLTLSLFATGTHADLATYFDESTLPANLYLDVPDTNVGTITLQTSMSRLLFSGPGADMWYSRNGVPFAWTPVPEVGIGGSWEAETEVEYCDTVAAARIVGMTLYSGPDGAGGANAGQEFTFGLDHWDGPNGVWVQGLGDNCPGDSANLVAALTADKVTLRMVVSRGSRNNNTYDFYYRRTTNDTWTSVGTIHHTAPYSRVALFFKGSQMNVAFNHFLVTTVSTGSQYACTTNANNTLTITEYAGSDCDLVVPDQIDGLPVSDIGDNAFDNCGSLTSVTIPPAITNIGGYAFYNCGSLTNVVMPNSVAAIGYSAFESCTALARITIPSNATWVGDYAFFNCTALTSATLPGSLTYLTPEMFGYCYNLSAVYFQGNAPDMDWSAFDSDWSVVFYYPPSTTGWETLSANMGITARPWNPTIQAGSQGFGPIADGYYFNIAGTPDIPIQVEACTNLTEGCWTPLLTTFLSNGSLDFTDASSTNFPVRFYRIVGP